MTDLLLHNRNFALLWLSQIISKLGDIFWSVAIMVTIFARTGSALQTVGVMVAAALPAFFLGPVAGVLVDRYPRKQVMITMDMVRAALVGILLITSTRGDLNIWIIYLIVAGLSIASTFFEPARLAILPSLVSKDDLVRANGLVMSTNQATYALGYALGGVMVLAIEFQTMIAVDFVSFLLAALAVAFIAVPEREREKQKQTQRLPMHRAVADGLSYLRNHKLARPLVTMEILEHFPHAIWSSALMLVFTTEALNAGPEFWGFQSSIYFGGMFVGALLAAAMSTRLSRRPGWAIIGNAFLFSGLTIGYALSPSLTFTLFLCFFFGPTSAIRDVSQDSLLQSQVDPMVMGRVYATRNMFSNLAFMLAGLSFAWMADQTNVRWVYLIGGMLYFGTALFALSSSTIRNSQITYSTTEGQEASAQSAA
ncbi:MAG: MFS transporter [Chloroflexota bacterium]|nr:MFS transporter [Chloroflexota bacterium]